MVLQLIVFLYATARDTPEENATQHHSAEHHSVEPSQTLSSKDTVHQHDHPPDEFNNSVQTHDDLIDEEHLEQHPAWNFMQEDNSSMSLYGAAGTARSRIQSQPAQALQQGLGPTRGPLQGLGQTRGAHIRTQPSQLGFGRGPVNPTIPGTNQFASFGTNTGTNPFASFGSSTFNVGGANRLNGLPNGFQNGTPTLNGFPNGTPSTLGQFVSQTRGGQINFCMPASLLPALLNQFLCILPTLLQTQPISAPADPVYIPVPNPIQVPVPNPIQVPVPVPNPIQVPVPVPNPIQVPVPVPVQMQNPFPNALLVNKSTY
jgi:hypothetical protein